MEVLRLVRELGLRPRRTLRVVLWTNEENGLAGAKAYCDSLGDGVSSHVAAIETDGGVEAPSGFGVEMNRVGLDSVDVAHTARVVERLRPIAPLLAELGAGDISDKGGGADIGQLMKKGVPGIAHRTVGTHYFDWHHTPADMLDKVDPVELRKNVAALAVMAWVLADMPGRLADPTGGEAAIGARKSP
jgi:Zn-dependent M28 family amino/carboxypeptidase